MSTNTVTRPSRSTTSRPSARPVRQARPARPATRPAVPQIPAQIPAQRSARPVSRPAPQGPVRLTRRGRVVVTLLIVGLILGALVIFSGQSVATGDAGAPVPTRTVVVGEGDTLWAIAAEVAGDGDIREAVHAIEKLNSLSGPALEVGQEIAVPVE
jgi:LysM repeat protein